MRESKLRKNQQLMFIKETHIRNSIENATRLNTGFMPGSKNFNTIENTRSTAHGTVTNTGRSYLNRLKDPNMTPNILSSKANDTTFTTRKF